MAITDVNDQIVKVNLIPNYSSAPVVYLSQYDTGSGRPLKFNVYDGDSPYTAPSGITIKLEGTRPDGVGFSYNTSKSGSMITVSTYTNVMTYLVGTVNAQLVFTNSSGARVGTIPITIKVERAGINMDTVISQNDFAAVLDAQNAYNTLNARLEAAIAGTTSDTEVVDIRVKADGTTASTAGNAVREQITELENDLETKYVGFRRYLTASDDCFALAPGAYGISSAANIKPSNLPPDFTTTANGYVIVLESQNNAVNVAFAIQAYAKRIWLRTGYEWVELAKTSYVYNTVESYVNNSLVSFATDFIPEFLHIAEDFYTSGSEISTTKTQYKFLGSSGVKDISTSYPDWYVTDEISVTPFTFYYITASARYADHYLYAIYDASYNILAYEASTSGTIVSINKKMIYMPYGASKIRIASVSGASGAAIFSAQEKSIYQKWSGLKWAAMGDSLTAINARTTMHYHDYIADDTGITVVNLGAGGTGYKKSYNGVSGFMDRVDTIPLDADVVTIFGSGNDNSYEIGSPTDTGTDTLCGCINTTISRIFERITTCNLGIITPTPWQAYNPANDANWMSRYSAAIVQICKNWSIPCLDLYHCSNLRPWDATFRAAAYSKDDGNGVHPDETGHKLIAPRFEAFLDELLMR